MDAQEAHDLYPLARALIDKGGFCLALAVIVVPVVLGVLDWNAVDMVAGAAAGIVVWGVFEYLLGVRRRLPSGLLRPPPAGATLQRPRNVLRDAPLVLVGGGVLLGVAWLLGGEAYAGAIVPGQVAGYAAANLLGAWQARRWERRHRAQLLVGHDSEGDEALFALPLGGAALRRA